MIQNRKRAFSLIEILIAIAIIALTASLVYPIVSGNRNKSAYEISVINLGSVAKAMEHHYLEKGSYPVIENKDWANLTKADGPLAEYLNEVPALDSLNRKYSVVESTPTGYTFAGLGLEGKMNKEYPDYTFTTGAKLKKGKKSS